MKIFQKTLFVLSSFIIIFFSHYNITYCYSFNFINYNSNHIRLCNPDHLECNISCEIEYKMYCLLYTQSPDSNISYEVFNDSNSSLKLDQCNNTTFKNTYSDISGILTFRGNNFRSSPSYGEVPDYPHHLSTMWKFNTSSLNWGGGCGWTGQPLIIKWPSDTREIMNLYDEFKYDEDFVEVVYASLDGRVYFLDLETGKETRPNINTKNVIKGTPSIDPRGYPLLYVGQGINTNGEFGYRIYSLIDGELLHFINGNDSIAYRGWGAFDGSPLINKDHDSMILGGENGLVYYLDLNTNFESNVPNIDISPETLRYRYKIEENNIQGIENSVCAFENLIYFADNGGNIQCVNINTLKPLWTFFNTDDTDATLTLSVEKAIPYIYTGNEVDHQGNYGTCYLRKINGLTGELVFEKSFPAYSITGSNPVNGGMLATNIIGKHDIDDLVIFNIARYNSMYGGLLVALNKSTGDEVWRFEMPNYAWSSPVDVYDSKGNSYIIQCDSVGNVYLIEGVSGKIIDKINLGSNIEGSPAVYNDTIVIGTRGGSFYGIKISPHN